jgi:hypothetical protein
MSDKEEVETVSKEEPRLSVNELRLMTQNTKLKMNALLAEANTMLAQAGSLQKDHNVLNEKLQQQYKELKEAMDVPEGMEVNLETGDLYDPTTLARS